VLFVDAETASLISLPDFGTWAYARHPSTRVLCWGMCGEKGDPWIGEALADCEGQTFVSWGGFDREVAVHVQGLDPHVPWIDGS
jgi:hypothetical protein